jgi:serine/threonine-protein kinase
MGRTVSGDSLRVGDWLVEPTLNRIVRDGEVRHLRPRLMDLLVDLAQHAGEVVTKDEILQRVWHQRFVAESVISRSVADLRRLLDDDADRPRVIETIPKRGYRLVTSVVRSDPTRVEAARQGAASGQAAPLGPAIAVLPFANLSADPDNEFLCDGISEELINGLTRLPDVRVVAHTSSFAFKKREVDVREIGARLNVTTVLEGSVRRSGDRLRISAQLIDACSGYHRWAEQYDLAAGNIFAVQEEIAQAVLRELRIEWLDGLARPLVAPVTADEEALALYLRGRYYWHRRYTGFMHRAIECFERAIAIDPRFALAHTGLADCYGSLGVWAFVAPRSVFPRAQALADRALALDDTLAEAHASRAFVKLFYEWDWAGTEQGLRRSLALNPGCALTRLWLGHYFSIVGRMDEAVTEVTRAWDLDPLSPVVSANVGWTHLLAGDVPRALEVLNRSAALDPLNAMAYFYLGVTNGAAGRYDEAAAMHRKARDIAPEFPGIREALGCAWALGGHREKALALLRESEAQRRATYVSGVTIGFLYAATGDTDAALDSIERAIEERDPMLVWLKFMPAEGLALGRIRTEPRLRTLFGRLGLR